MIINQAATHDDNAAKAAQGADGEANSFLERPSHGRSGTRSDARR